MAGNGEIGCGVWDAMGPNSRSNDEEMHIRSKEERQRSRPLWARTLWADWGCRRYQCRDLDWQEPSEPELISLLQATRFLLNATVISKLKMGN